MNKETNIVDEKNERKKSRPIWNTIWNQISYKKMEFQPIVTHIK